MYNIYTTLLSQKLSLDQASLFGAPTWQCWLSILLKLNQIKKHQLLTPLEKVWIATLSTKQQALSTNQQLHVSYCAVSITSTRELLCRKDSWFNLSAETQTETLLILITICNSKSNILQANRSSALKLTKKQQSQAFLNRGRQWTMNLAFWICHNTI